MIQGYSPVGHLILKHNRCFFIWPNAKVNTFLYHVKFFSNKKRWKKDSVNTSSSSNVMKKKLMIRVGKYPDRKISNYGMKKESKKDNKEESYLFETLPNMKYFQTPQPKKKPKKTNQQKDLSSEEQCSDDKETEGDGENKKSRRLQNKKILKETNKKVIRVLPNENHSKFFLRKKYNALKNISRCVPYVYRKYELVSKKEQCVDNSFDLFERKSMEQLEREIEKTSEKENGKEKVVEEKEANECQEDSLQSQNANKNEIIKKIYKASINHVRDENLWKKYVQNVFIISAYLDSSEIVILFWCFGKIGYRDKRLINLLCSIILKRLNELNTCALALLLNILKKLEVPKYDTIELITNEFCFRMKECSFQDLALVANALSFFYIYHKTFWKRCIFRLQNDYSFSTPLHICLIVSSFARLDIREGNVLLSLSKSTKRVAKDLSPNNLALVIHSFAKLKFHHPKFYNSLYKFVHFYLDRQQEMESKALITKNPTKKEKKEYFDAQSLVLLLFSSVCLISCTEQMILKLSYLLIPHKEYLGDHKMEKLKMVSGYLLHVYPCTFQKLPEEIKEFYSYIEHYEIKKKQFHERRSRWVNEVSRILSDINVSHVKNVYINNICATIMLTDSNVIIKCLGPYSYYVNSLVQTSISEAQTILLEKKNYQVISLSYQDWNNLSTYEEKVNFLYAFGRKAANYLLLRSKGNQTNTTTRLEAKEEEHEESDSSFNKEEKEPSWEEYSSDEESVFLNYLKKELNHAENTTEAYDTVENDMNHLKSILCSSKK